MDWSPGWVIGTVVAGGAILFGIWHYFLGPDERRARRNERREERRDER